MIRIAVVVAVVVLLVPGCGGDEEDAVGTLEGQWLIDGVAGPDDAIEGQLVGAPRVTFLLDGSVPGAVSVAGSTGCNRFTGTATIGDDGSFSAGPFASTLMGCDDVLARQESNIHAAFEAADHWSVVDNLASLSEGEGIVMEMHRLDTELAGSAWSVTHVNNGKGGLQSVMAGTDPTLLFGTDDKVSGSTGCNILSGTYESADESLAFGSIGLTKKLCGSPAGVMDQEQQMVAALGRSSTYSIDGNTLTIRDTGGAALIVGER